MNENEEVQVQEPKKSNTMMTTVVIIAIGVVGLLLLQNVMGTKDTAPTGNTTQESTVPAAVSATPTMDGSETGVMTGDTMMISDPSEVQVIKMDMGAFYYSPNTITVKKGQKVRIELTSKDMMHDFNIDALKVKSPIVKAGDTATVEFVADQVGEFEYYCSVGQHRSNGQVGTLIVEE